MQTTIAILAGGQSRRMGRDKAGILVDGEALLERTARLAREVCASVIVVGRTAAEGWPLGDVAFWPDATGGQGPIGGLATALERAEGQAILLVGCDMPLLTARALEWLVREGEAQGPLADGIVTVNGGQREPLFSLYTPGCLPLVRRQMASGRRSLQALIEAGRFASVVPPPDIHASLRDIDTPEDLADFIQSLRRSP